MAQLMERTPTTLSLVDPWHGHEAYAHIIDQAVRTTDCYFVAVAVRKQPRDAGEFRVTFSTAPSSRTTSSSSSSSSRRCTSTRHCNKDDPNRMVACVAVGQRANRITAAGLGNPHVRCLTTTESSVLLPIHHRKNEDRVWWFILSTTQLLLACGVGNSPSQESAKLVFKLTPTEAQNFSQSPFVTVGFSNWKAPVNLEILDIASKSDVSIKQLSFATHKWFPDGTLKRFEGNTLICFLPPSSRLYACLVEAQSLLRKNPNLSPFLGFLPPSSFHMTVCGLHTSMSPSRFAVTTHSNESPGRSPSDMNHEIKGRVPLEIQASSPWTIFQMECKDISIHRLHLKPATPAQEGALTTYRQIVSNAAGFEFRANYEFHITLCYILHPMVRTQLVQEVHRARSEICPFWHARDFSCLRCPRRLKPLAQ